MITPEQRHRLLMADRTFDEHARSSNVAAAIIDVLNDNPEATLYDCELAFRDAAGRSYVIANGDGFRIVFGMFAWREALKIAGLEAKDHARLLQSSRMAQGQAPGAA
jgi:hypothetical protein